MVKMTDLVNSRKRGLMKLVLILSAVGFILILVELVFFWKSGFTSMSFWGLRVVNGSFYMSYFVILAEYFGIFEKMQKYMIE